MASSAEREIRDAVVSWYHQNEPRGRVVHEIPLSGFSAAGRADIGVIFPDYIALVEIKSEKDKLDRLEKQFGEMIKRAHDVRVVCHEKWFTSDDGLKDQSWVRWSHKEHFWRYPAPSKGWQFNRYVTRLQPENIPLLCMLWADELRDCYKFAGVMAASSKMTMTGMISDLHDKLTGRQVREVVCRCLRGRTFAEADAPIVDAAP